MQVELAVEGIQIEGLNPVFRVLNRENTNLGISREAPSVG